MKAQPPLWMRPLSIVPETLSSESVARAPQSTKAKVSAAVTPNTTRSVLGRPPPGRPASEPGSRPPPWWVVLGSCVTGGTFPRVAGTELLLPSEPTHM
ncbi:hypothetical protein GCM10027075_15210 [Streptomyces heilongjiangensis]